MYIMLSGHLPFSSKQKEELINKIIEGSFSFKLKEFRSVSLEGKDLIKKMLVVDPNQRLTAA